ncbi:hypothetical protein IQ06DRAFT_133658 [Phaeosphaeriaceae sp. SRC1lsM3a]|nr:hypothetical protein IQ06DRAFT_133658 [Stagonospora sp. SRC1lsM3a]
MRKTRSECWGLVAEGALEKQRFQSMVVYSQAEASRAVTFHVPRFRPPASFPLFFRRPLPPQRARNTCMHAHITRPSLSSNHNLLRLHAIHGFPDGRPQPPIDNAVSCSIQDAALLIPAITCKSAPTSHAPRIWSSATSGKRHQMAHRLPGL